MEQLNGQSYRSYVDSLKKDYGPTIAQFFEDITSRRIRDFRAGNIDPDKTDDQLKEEFAATQREAGFGGIQALRTQTRQEMTRLQTEIVVEKGHSATAGISETRNASLAELGRRLVTATKAQAELLVIAPPKQ